MVCQAITLKSSLVKLEKERNMINLWFAAFLFFCAGLFLILGIHPVTFVQDIQTLTKSRKKIYLNDRIKAIHKDKKQRGIKKIVSETQYILKITNKEGLFIVIVVLSIILMVVGIFLALILNNPFLAPVFALGFSMCPFWYLQFTLTRWKKEINQELETALSVITTSYIRSDSIIRAIEENIEYINPPVHTIFLKFLTQTRLINSNTKKALETLKMGIENEIFQQWVDVLIDCQEDKNLKVTLIPIVAKLSDVRMITGEIEYLLYEPMKEFVTMLFLLLGNIPLMYMLNKEWYKSLMYSNPGKIVLAITATCIFVSFSAVVRLSRPVEFKR